MDVAASKQADVPEAKLNGTAATPASTRRTGVKAATGSGKVVAIECGTSCWSSTYGL